jgi:hypothetical protein
VLKQTLKSLNQKLKPLNQTLKSLQQTLNFLKQTHKSLKQTLKPLKRTLKLLKQTPKLPRHWRCWNKHLSHWTRSLNLWNRHWSRCNRRQSYWNWTRSNRNTNEVTETDIELGRCWSHLICQWKHWNFKSGVDFDLLGIITHHHWLDSPTWALAFLRSLCQLKYPAITSSDFVTSLSQGGVVSPTPNPQLSWRAYVFCQGCLP